MTFLSKIRPLLFLIITLIIALGCYILLEPDNPMMHLFRGEISDINANVIIGPYPTEKDFLRLKSAKVGNIISLLDPALPYERILLDQEKLLAKKYSMKFMNFPMTSILGYKVGREYDNNAKSAADAVTVIKGKTYVHCYLGIHRAKIVKNIIESRNQEVGNYLLHEGERSQLAQIQDEAERLYNQRNYKETKVLLSRMSSQDFPSMMLNGWSSYHLKNIQEARKLFANALIKQPKSEDAETGLAYCDLSENKLEDALDKFTAIIARGQKNETALSGAGFVLYRQGKFDESLKLLQRALAINPDDADVTETLKRIQKTQQSKN